MTTTTTQSFTFNDVLGADVGTKFKVSTDNDLYGTTVEKTDDAIVNSRTGQPLALTATLVTSKFRVVSTDKQITLGAFLEAYRAGKKLKVEVGDKYRFVQKQDDILPEELKQLMKVLPIQAVGMDDVMTFEELTEGKFYIVE